MITISNTALNDRIKRLLNHCNESDADKNYEIQFFCNEGYEYLSDLKNVERIKNYVYNTNKENGSNLLKTRKQRLEDMKYDPKIICTVCGELIWRVSMEYHMNFHNDIRPYKCNFKDCKFEFFSPFKLNDHKKRHDKSMAHICDICEKKFSESKYLTRHRHIHFPPTVPCPVCKKLFRTK